MDDAKAKKLIITIFQDHVLNKGINRCLDLVRVRYSNGESVGCYYGYQVNGTREEVKYEHDGVKIEYEYRMRSHLGDTDMMGETTVSIDGNVVYHRIS